MINKKCLINKSNKNMTNKKEIIEIFKNKSLGKYYNNKDLMTDDLLTEDNLIHAMYEILEHELDLNDNGRKFLQEYWGLDNIADIIFDYEETDGDFHKEFTTKEKLIDWLKHKRKLQLITEE